MRRARARAAAKRGARSESRGTRGNQSATNRETCAIARDRVDAARCMRRMRVARAGRCACPISRGAPNVANGRRKRARCARRIAARALHLLCRTVARSPWRRVCAVRHTARNCDRATVSESWQSVTTASGGSEYGKASSRRQRIASRRRIHVHRAVRSGRDDSCSGDVAATARAAPRFIVAGPRERRSGREACLARGVRPAFRRASRRRHESRGIRAAARPRGRARRSGREPRRAVGHDRAVRGGLRREARALRASVDRPVSRPHGRYHAARRVARHRHRGARARRSPAGPAAFPAAADFSARARRPSPTRRRSSRPSTISRPATARASASRSSSSAAAIGRPRSSSISAASGSRGSRSSST